MVIEHTPGKLEEDIKKGDKLLMGGVKYTVEKVGDAANDNIRDEGHCTIVFNATGSMPGQIIVKGPAQRRSLLVLTSPSPRNKAKPLTFLVMKQKRPCHRQGLFLSISSQLEI
mgnify:CR=1 FL=1